MHNKVVHTLARAMHELGVASVRFNFRGVGESQGSFAEGVGEVDDVVAVADWVRARHPEASLWAGGFSFGGMVAYNSVNRIQPAQLITIAPAVGRVEPVGGAIAIPWLLVQGDADEIVPPAEVIAWIESLGLPPEQIILAGVGHFFHGHLIPLRKAVVEHLSGAVS
jgi:alpha/beta superfamily hydrolase